MPTHGQIVLSALAVDTICTRLNVKLPPLLKPIGFGDTEEERRMLHQRAWRDLESRGLVEYGELNRFLEDTFRTLARPALAVWATMMLDRQNGIDAVAAADGDFAVLAKVESVEGTPRTELSLTLEATRPTGLAYAAVGLLPDHPAGRGHSISHPAEQIEQAATSGARSATQLRTAFANAGLRGTDAEFLAEVLSAERKRAGEFTARSFDPLSGRLRKSEYRVDFMDNVTGRFFLQQKTGSDGRRWFTLAPSDKKRLGAQVAELCSLVAPRN
ncbi:hypothetical protein FHR81_005418 [Actinoalloteichus hoggarensis]|uniref:Uncharacterized protein n=1 Tax=Actinoalloteichus hoggarensis TaxID=1470176 RepID=A0A221VWJ8_9PSEU|nr:ESX secretion-associated protein EspG [Actinoalloteichus hoggarensis]ASO17929.1 hypothetical protein AHOG_01315 [Actinoalloteichus hoggarensis]MBB5924341.1 hypothetical protein [Actinoalloteichus hoggarensis]